MLFLIAPSLTAVFAPFKFAPCKRYFNPRDENGAQMFACRLHNQLRMDRLKKEGGKWRDGEKHLEELWNKRKDTSKNFVDDVCTKKKAGK